MNDRRVTAKQVSEARRLTFLPSKIGANYLRFERYAYRFAETYTEYDGDFWHMYELSNGGFYMAPKLERDWKFVNEMNSSDVVISSDALGIIVSLYALSHMSFADHSLSNFYHLLYEYALEHPEYDKIAEAID